MAEVLPEVKEFIKNEKKKMKFSTKDASCSCNLEINLANKPSIASTRINEASVERGDDILFATQALSTSISFIND
jgi:hypothetical protein